MASPNTAKRAKKQGKEPFDYSLMLIVLGLVVFGLVVLYSTSAYNGQVKFADKAYYLKKQFLLIGKGQKTVKPVLFLFVIKI